MKEPILFELPLVPCVKNGIPSLEVRKATSDQEIVKKLIECAIHSVPVIVLPTFRSKLLSLGRLCEMGILYREGDQYYFNY